jgi:predicted transcriptional regulator
MVRPGEIVEKAGLDKKIISEVIKELKKEGKIIIPKRCYYTLKE